MDKAMGVINVTLVDRELEELTNARCIASVPFGGKYRLVDFGLSNLVNAGIKNVSIFTVDRYRSIMNHVGNGREWDLDLQEDGLFVFPPSKIPYPTRHSS